MDMWHHTDVLIIVVISALAELIIYKTSIGWKHRKPLAISIFAVLVALLLFASTRLWLPLALLFIIVTLYRTLSLLRVVQDRNSSEHIKFAGQKSMLYLAAIQIVIVVFAGIIVGFDEQQLLQALLSIIVAASALVAIIALVGTIYSILKTKTVGGDPLSDKELPTVTVAVPARNETEQLSSCLEAAIASNYPKLEILVLDDCSQDKTAMVIKSFAHDGVRFVQGEPTPADWLAKNFAYSKLQQESTGKFILFIGVDVRLHKDSVRELVQTMIARNLTMVSLVPKRTKSGIVAAFVQPMRYFWELAIPRFVRKWPPTLSTCWMIERNKLEKIGGFESVKRAILPERHFARKLEPAYQFLRTHGEAVITTHKDFASQWSTAIRTRYPQVHRRPEIVCLQSIAIGLLLVAPFYITIASDIASSIKLTAFIASLCFAATYTLINAVTNPVAAWLAPFNFWLIALLDILALNLSMYEYEFGKVLWKGRNVCMPVLRVIPKLPNIDTK
jgi:glycosyltransferase involved in cell wall biosynthesis